MPAHARPVFVAAGIALALAGRLYAQAPTDTPPPASVVRALLESAALKDQAWGAWWVANGAPDQFASQLRSNLEEALDLEHTARNQYYNQFVLDATIDALIRLGHNDLPPDLLAAVYTQRSEAAVILAAESSLSSEAMDPFLQTVLADDQASGLHVAWLGAADLLLLHHAPGTVAALLRNVTFTAHAVLCDPSVAPAPYETTVAALRDRDCGRIVQGYGGSWPSSIPDPTYPPWIHYDLAPPSQRDAAKKARAGQVMLIDGGTDATSLIYVRYSGSSGPPTHGPVTTADRLALLAARAAPGVELPAIEGAVLVVPWRDDTSAQTAIAAFRQTLLQRYAALIADLHAVGGLTGDEAAALAVPTISLVTDDRRN